jgi:phage tail sheath protein FI
MAEYVTPGVYFEFVDAPAAVRGVRTDIAGFVGLAERGPLHEPVQIESWRQFQSRFGAFLPYGYLAYAVKGFFENFGRTCFIVRIGGADAKPASLMLKNDDGPTGVDVIKLSAKNEGVWGNTIAIDLRPRPAARQFSLAVTRDGRDREVFQNLSVDPDDRGYFLHLINQGDERTSPSQWISATLAGAASGTDLMPNPVKSGLTNGIGFLSGAKDGVASLTKDDFLGDVDPLAVKKGLSAFEHVDAVAIVCIPDIHVRPAPIPLRVPPPAEPPQDPCRTRSTAAASAAPATPVSLEQPPRFSDDVIAEVQRSMIEHCERMADRVAVLDAPVDASGKPLSISGIQNWRRQFDSQRGFAALYYPWVKALDPLKLDGNQLRAVPPCGHIAGLYARTDFATGVHKAPANEELFWAEDVTASVNDEAQGVLNPEGINCLRAFPGRGIRVYGARTVCSDPDWRYVNVRRLLLMIEEAVDEATQWAVFEPHNFILQQTLALSVSSFLETLWRQGALVGDTPDQAFYVKCDENTNPPQVINEGKIITEVGVAPTHPAEFIVFSIGRTVGELELVER